MNKKEKLMYVSLGVMIDYLLFKPTRAISKIALFLGGVAVGFSIDYFAPLLLKYIERI